MKINRMNLNHLKTLLITRLNKILAVYESCEEESHFDAFITMVDNHFEYCQFWLNKFKPTFGRFQRHKYNIYKDYYLTAQYTLNKMNDLITAYQEETQKLADKAELFEITKTKMEIEHYIAQELQEAYDEQLRKEYHKKIMGFVSYPAKKKRNKRKKKDD